MASERGGLRPVDRSERRAPDPRRWLLGSASALGVAAALALPATGWTQPAPPAVEASDADKEKARSLMDVGVEREEAKDYAAALKAFEAAHALVKLPMTGLAVARAQAALGRLVEALESATQAKLIPVRPGETPAYGKARAEADALAQKLAARVPSILVKVEGPSGGAEVAIDGAVVPAPSASQPRKVNPGKHVVAATAPGFKPASVEVDVPEGQVTPATLTMTPELGPDRGKSGGLSPLVLVGFGVGAAGLIAGAVTGGLSLSKTSTIRKQCDANGICPRTTADAISSANTLANVSNVSFALGAAGVAVGVVGIFLSSPSSSSPASGSSGAKSSAASGGVRVMPVIGPGSVAVIGVF